MDKNLERFFRYVGVDTQANPAARTCPSSPGQLTLAKMVVEDLKEIGIQDINLDEHGYLFATIPANVEGVPTFGLICHLDTALELGGKCDHPQIVEYSGGDIRLNDQFSISEKEFPQLKNVLGHTLITTDGTSLLGADNKAGIVILLAVAEHLLRHPEIPHGDIRLAITPDEEIGRGPERFNVEKFAADFAYTVDGGAIGGMEYENFNAASAHISIQGKSVHPGSAKNILINALRVALEIESMLPVEQKPEYTENYEGFFMLDIIQGSVDSAEMDYIIRDHDLNKFKAKKDFLQSIVDFLNNKYGDIIELEFEDSYYNMREKIEPMMGIIDMLAQSMRDVGVEPDIKPIRGGSDGAQLSYMGLPCPNMFTGGYNFHGRYEFLSVDEMNKAIEVIIKLAENNVHWPHKI
ncbi:peptidase T [Ignavigranum ruoffiae]|uniref:Peptidase T n=1 Tax=Ignavigranum ruoffiae TaxID=89093 RepID=A0A1H8YV69_9LACT|nr:peptidase T [Ignavigranum ruoffiae]UPQ85362.1 peptidase T [Ignavigranum ruoffiae]SEP56009.1 tripeptide aminopeptidase [Ignavigranum ruoffiae]